MKKYLIIFCLLIVTSCGLRGLKEPYFDIEQTVTRIDDEEYKICTSIMQYEEYKLTPFEIYTTTKVIATCSNHVYCCKSIDKAIKIQMYVMIQEKNRLLACFKKYPEMKFVSPVIDAPFNFSRTIEPTPPQSSDKMLGQK